MHIVATSDTHEDHRKLKVPDGDVFVHAGDFTFRGEKKYVKDFNDWLGTLPHRYKIVIAGNHDLSFDCTKDESGIEVALLDKDRHLQREGQSRLSNATHYLLNSGCEIEGKKFWGSPYTPRFFDWAFMYDRAAGQLQWEGIPKGLDVLITHGPPMNILDKNAQGVYCGCWDLNRKILEVKPRFHLFGHIHEGYGRLESEGTVHMNLSAKDQLYKLRANPCMQFDV